MKRKQEEAWVKQVEMQFKDLEKAEKKGRKGKNVAINGSELISGDSNLSGSKKGPEGVSVGINNDNTFEYDATPGGPEFATPGGPEDGQPNLVP